MQIEILNIDNGVNWMCFNFNVKIWERGRVDVQEYFMNRLFNIGYIALAFYYDF